MHPVHRNAWAVLLVAIMGCQAPAPSAPAAAPAAPTAAAPAAPTSAPTAAAPTTGGMPSPLSPQVTVRVGTLSTVSDAGLYIGLERGYYRELGLNLEIETIPLPDTVGQLVASNHLDVGGYGVNTNPFMAATRGIGVKIVADKGSMRPGFGYNPVLTRRDLYESGQIRTAADLRGRKIARLGQCDSHDPFFQRLLGSAGLTYDDVEFVLLSFPDMNPALANGAIDAAVQIEPLATLALERGFASLIVTGDEVYPNQQLAALYFAAEFAARTEVAQRFMVAYVRALRDYNAAFVKNSGRAEIVQILAKHTTVKDVPLYDRFIPAGLDPNGRPNLEGIRNDVALLQRMGCIPSDVPDLVGRVVDESFVNYAVSVLGPY